MPTTAPPPMFTTVRVIRPVLALGLEASQERTYRFDPTRDGLPLTAEQLRLLADALHAGDVESAPVDSQELFDWLRAYAVDCRLEA